MTTATAQVDPDKIHINSVRLLEAHFETSDHFLQNPVPLAGTNVQIGQTTGLNLESNGYAVKMDIILNGCDENNQDLGVKARYVIHFGFVIDNLNDFVHIENNMTNIDSRLGATVLGIAYSTARGIVVERTQGSFFNGAILPVLNPVTLLNIPTPEVSANPSSFPVE